MHSTCLTAAARDAARMQIIITMYLDGGGDASAPECTKIPF